MILNVRIWLRVLWCFITRTRTAPPPCGAECTDGSRCGDKEGRFRVRCFDCVYAWLDTDSRTTLNVSVKDRLWR